jgi:hypothetical protein
MAYGQGQFVKVGAGPAGYGKGYGKGYRQRLFRMYVRHGAGSSSRRQRAPGMAGMLRVLSDCGGRIVAAMPEVVLGSLVGPAGSQGASGK